jgi:hypothetical protein
MIVARAAGFFRGQPEFAQKNAGGVVGCVRMGTAATPSVGSSSGRTWLVASRRGRVDDWSIGTKTGRQADSPAISLTLSAGLKD